MMARTVIILCALLAAISLWIAAAPLLGRVFGHETAMASSKGTETASAQPLLVDLGPVLDFAPFGMAEPARAVSAPDGVQTGFVLLGITASQSPNASRAIISGGDVPVANYGIGARLAEGVVLVSILSDHVILSVGGQDQSLSFLRGDGADAVELLQPVVSLTPNPADGDTRLGRYRTEIMNDPDGLLQRLGLKPTDQGYLVTDAASDEILQAGLLPGDLVSGLNGKPLGDPAQGVVLFDEVAALGQASLAVMRDGETLLMTFPLK